VAGRGADSEVNRGLTASRRRMSLLRFRALVVYGVFALALIP
jgi:hypothetical protein